MFIPEAFAHVAEGGTCGIGDVGIESVFGVGEEAQDHVFVSHLDFEIDNIKLYQYS